MKDEQLAYWIGLNRVEGLGPKRFHRILREWGDPEAAWRQREDELVRVLGEKVAQAFIKIRRTDPRKELERIYKEGISVVTCGEDEYPANLKEIPDPPPVLYYRGRMKKEDQIALAIVGSRNPTPNGLYNAEELAAALAEQGIVIVSGMARGIDSAAHRGALAGRGRTIAVMGSGLDYIYPPENRELAESIAENGLLVSEFPLGMRPYPGNFPARNRVISGLSLGVLVIEAARDSGSLITAGFALEQGREVFAVPGPIRSEACFGSNRLIQQGAHLVQSIEDVLEGLNLTRITAQQLSAVKEERLNPEEERVMQALTDGPKHIDLIVRDSGLAASEVAGLLVVLELKGLVQPLAGRSYRRVR